jgi:hypothetical protein
MSASFAWEKISFIKALDALVDYHNLVREKMATTTVTPKKPNKFVSFMDHIGHDFKTGLDKVLPIAETAGEAAVTIFAPGAATLFKQTVAAVATAEQSAAAIGQASGTGPQKLSAVMTLMGPLIKQALADVGKPADDASAQKYVSAVVTILNAMPAPAPATSSTVAAAPVVIPAATANETEQPTTEAPASGPSGASSILG